MVWITIGASSPVAFSALKKNSIQVYPISAKQYVGGTWVDVTAKSYQGGEWLSWKKDLFKSGSGAFVPLSTYLENTSNVSATINTEKIYIKTKNTQEAMSRVETTDLIDITNFNTVYIDAHITYKGASGAEVRNGFVFGVSTARVPWGDNVSGYVSKKIDNSHYGYRYIFSLDISTLSGAHYLSFGGFIDAEVYNWWLE